MVVNNKNGYVLVYALGIITVLMILTASLTNLTMNRSFFSNKNIQNIKQINKANTQVEAAASELAIELEAFNQAGNNEYKYLHELETFYRTLFTGIENTYHVTIRDLTKESCVYPNDPNKPLCHPVDLESYTYAYEIVYDDGHVVAQKKFFLSMIPSFLYFALGSKSDITINGGAYIEGDIYIENNIFLSNVTNYSLNNTLLTERSTYLTMNPNNSIYIKNKMYSCKESDMVTCYDTITDSTKFSYHLNNFNPVTFYTTTFTNTPPTVKQTYNDRFLDVNFDASYLYYINDSIGKKYTSNLDYYININDLTTEFNEFITEGLLDDITSQSEINSLSTLSYIFTGTTLFNQSVTLNKDHWIIVDGDLEISNYLYDIIKIDANILVTGNIKIKGNVDFNSTIYALGKGIIENASIRGTNANQLVLLTKDNLEFRLLNSFDNGDFNNRFRYFPDTGSTIITPHIKGFFYTDTNAQLFTTASYIVLEGGIFTNDRHNHLHYPINKEDYNNYTFVTNDDANSIGLTINSYRGLVEDQITSFKFTPSSRVEQSRLVIKHNIDVIKQQPKGLPLNTQINYIFEGVTIK